MEKEEENKNIFLNKLPKETSSFRNVTKRESSFLNLRTLTGENNNNVFTILVADDEQITRQSTIRILNSIAKDKNIQLKIIEAEDGAESIYFVYHSQRQGHKIACIFSDESMNFVNGSLSAEIIKKQTEKNSSLDIPFFLVTAYSETSKFNSKYIKELLSKPLSREKAVKIFDSIFV